MLCEDKYEFSRTRGSSGLISRNFTMSVIVVN